MQKTDLSAKGLTVKRIQTNQQNVIHEICFLNIFSSLCLFGKWMKLERRDMAFLSLKVNLRNIQVFLAKDVFPLENQMKGLLRCKD